MNTKTYLLLILVLAAALRLWHLTYPLVGANSWRQADTAAMARNYHENGYRFAYPQIDWGGAGEGYVETEFPIYSYLLALLYGLFGVHEAIGRILSTVFSLAALLGVFYLARALYNERAGLWSAFLFAILPLNAYYGRNIIPEPLMLCSLVWGVYAFMRWVENEQLGWLVLSAAAVAMACLLKIVCLYIGLPLVYLAWTRYRWSLIRQPLLWLYALAVVAPVAAWYWHAHQLLLTYGNTFGIWEYGSDKWGNWNLLPTWKFWNGIIFQSLAEKHLTWTGFLLLLAGAGIARRTAQQRLADFWMLALLVYVVIVARGNAVHYYYQLPFTIPAVLYIGNALDSFLNSSRSVIRNAALAGLAGVLVLSTIRFMDFLQEEKDATLNDLRLASFIAITTDRHSRLAMLDNHDPTMFYLTKRKGWNLSTDEVTPVALDSLEKAGARYLAGSFKSIPDNRLEEMKNLFNRYPKRLTAGDDFVVVLSK